MLNPVLLPWLVIGALAAAVLNVAMADRAAAEEGRNLAAATEQCKKASDKQVVIAACSTVIAMSHDARLLERAYDRRGLANEATGQFNGAVNDFSQVIRLDPKVAGYFDNRMRAYKALGLLDLALKDADTAVAMAPTYSFVFHGRGAVRFDRGDYGRAIEDYTAALSINRADAPLLVDRGRALMKLGQLNNAMRDFSEAHAVDPAFTPALRERGLAAALIGDADQARADLGPIVAADAGDREASAALESLNGSATPAATTEAESQRMADESTNSSSGAAESAEAEARQKMRERKDAEIAREEASRRLKEERLARAKAEALSVRGDASDFVKGNRDDPQLMDHLQRITDLGAMLGGTEPDPIERKTTLLSAGLASDPAYTAYAERRKAERRRNDERTLIDALATLRVQKRFLVGTVVQDPTAAEAPRFLSLAKQVDEVVATPDLVRAQTVMGTIDATIAGAKMSERYEAERQAAAAEDRAAADKGSSAKPAP